MLIREAIAQGSADLKYAGIPSAGLDAALLLSHVLKKNRASILAAGDESISEKNCAAFCELIEKRCEGVCIAYLIGKKEFMGLEFAVNNSVLVPRPDTETLAEAALEILNGLSRIKETGILDLCTGSGAVAIAIKNQRPGIDVHAADISSEALEIAQTNAARLLGEDQIKFYHGDLFDALPAEPKVRPYSLITANPPYIPSDEIHTLSAEVRNEPRIALDGGLSGLEVIKNIIKDSPLFLRNGGSLLMEADPRQMEDITVLLKTRGFVSIKIYKDLAGLERVIGGKYEK